jgi:hypothetical protein
MVSGEEGKHFFLMMMSSLKPLTGLVQKNNLSALEGCLERVASEYGLGFLQVVVNAKESEQ